MNSAVLLAVCLANLPGEKEFLRQLPDIFGRAAANYRALDAAATPRARDAKGNEKIPRTYDAAKRKVHMVRSTDWTAGHYAGALWYLHEATKDDFFKDRAQFWMQLVATNATVTSNHDVGFIMYCSYGNARRLLKTDAYDALLLQTADSLTKRYDSGLGLIRSWGKLDEKRNFQVIPDNLMNLELLEWAAKAKGGEARFDAIARSHAKVTDANHYRADSSCYHVLDYDQVTHRVKEIERGQGASCLTAWSRGQSWSIYGFTMMYRETREPSFLKRAVACADFAIGNANMPADGVPYWDYGAPGEERDSSAAAIMASALVELAGFVGGEKGAHYRAFAVRQLASLSSPAYFAKPDEIGGFLLKHGVGAKPLGTEIDVPLNYGDYYYLEALLRLSSTSTLHLK